VDETQAALVLSFGRTARGPIVEAGLHLKRPWQSVRKFDRRLQLLMLGPREKLTGDHEPVVVQPYACWRIAPEAVELYLRSVVDRADAEDSLTDLIWSALDRELSTHALTDWVNTTGDHAAAGLLAQARIMDGVTRTCRPEARQRFGIELLGVHLRRLTRPERMKEDIYRLMIADRQRAAHRIRQASKARTAQIKATARQEADRLPAEAKRLAGMIRAQGRAEADRLWTEARRLDPELTALAEKLESYRRLLDDNATLVLAGDPDVFGVPPRPAPPLVPSSSQAAPTPATRPGG